MLEKVMLVEVLAKVVVAIGSYVDGIYSPLIPYSAKVDPLTKLAPPV
jgi:hypothetical protein